MSVAPLGVLGIVSQPKENFTNFEEYKLEGRIESIFDNSISKTEEITDILSRIDVIYLHNSTKFSKNSCQCCVKPA